MRPSKDTDSQIPIGDIIKQYIKLRGKTIQEVAAEVGEKEKTFYDQLKKSSISSILLLKLTNILDLDIKGFAKLYSNEPTNLVGYYNVPRMSQEYRDKIYKGVSDTMDYVIKMNPGSISDAKNELLRIYHSNLFFLLDVLLDTSYTIEIERENINRGKPREIYKCKSTFNPTSEVDKKALFTRKEYTGNEMIKIIIEQRKETIKK